jgi:uncharacterized protein YbjT (DUF2867 family)
MAAAAVTALGAKVRRGDLDDLDGLREAAADADGVIHLAFNYEQMRSGDFAAAVATKLAVVHALGQGFVGVTSTAWRSSGRQPALGGMRS